MKVDSNVLAANVVTKVLPVYPRLARQSGIQGPVSLQATVGTDGRIIVLQPISGHPLLIPAAIEAARLWVYRPFLLNGMPVEVVGQIEIKFAWGEALWHQPAAVQGARTWPLTSQRSSAPDAPTSN
jgi:protein TonB